MNKILRALGLGQIGVVIPNLVLQGKPAPYPVVNERAVRAGAGIAFLLGVFAFFHAFYLQDFTYLKWLLPLLWLISWLRSYLVQNSPPYRFWGSG